MSSPRNQRSAATIALVVFGVLGGAMLLVCVGCIGVFSWLTSPPQASEAASQPFDLSSVPVPPLPDRGAGELVEPGVVRYEVQLGPASGAPGHGRIVWLYLPEGSQAPQSLPCVVIAPAGSDMISGMGLAEGDMPEHLPYVHEGFAVVSYEIDGFGDDLQSSTDGDQLVLANYAAFRSACAGLVNARNALEYVLAQAPEVDPARIYTAGHSSAATLALLLAEHDTRIAGCAAYAPVHDIGDDMGGAMVRFLSSLLPGIADFVVQSSPKTHFSRMNSPIFLFHAEDDSAVDVEQTRAADQTLKDLGKDVTTVIVAAGDHYDSMIEEGMPQGIEWLKAQAGMTE